MKTIKVEINGVNTAELPVLSAKDQMEMLKKIKQGHTELKDEFVRANLRLVLSLVKKFKPLSSSSVPLVFSISSLAIIVVLYFLTPNDSGWKP